MKIPGPSPVFRTIQFTFFTALPDLFDDTHLCVEPNAALQRSAIVHMAINILLKVLGIKMALNISWI